MAIKRVGIMDNTVKVTHENRAIVAKWAFKNVIMLYSASNYRQLVPESHYLTLYNGDIPKGLLLTWLMPRQSLL